MSANRKLQTEIDRTLKKVEEGVEIFDDIWDKVYSASQQNQKEKYEVDLKKEIKKLQRHRDQIKTWIASSDIKDKRALMDARKLIETKMEQFKVCEKETKTKTYSKEGLAREAKLDPEEAKKQEKREWCQDCIDKLTTQMEAVEAEIEKLMSKKKPNKAELEVQEGHLKRHKWHIGKLEQIVRLIDNDVVSPAQVEDVKEDVEYYIDSNTEADFLDAYDPECDIFESLELGDLEAELDAGGAGGGGGGGGGGAAGKEEPQAAAADKKDDKKKDKKEDKKMTTKKNKKKGREHLQVLGRV